MPYSDRMQRSHLYSTFFAPRGYVRMADLGMQIAQQYLSPFDKLVGLVGDAGSGKSMLIKGMFPGLDLSNDDEGVNERPLPLLGIYEQEDTFYSPHTYHVDIRFEAAFTQMHMLADAIQEAVRRGKRVIVEHFDLIYPFLDRNAHLLIGIGEELIITRPTLFGPEPKDIANIVMASLGFRRMTHSGEDIVAYLLQQKGFPDTYEHADVRHGFIFKFYEKPDIDLVQLEKEANEMVAKDVTISFLDDDHILIGQDSHPCSGPRMHVKSAGDIQKITINPEFLVEPITNYYLLVAIVGEHAERPISDLNRIIP